MDPEACLKALDEALKADDREGVFESADYLIAWLLAQGYRPEFPLGQSDWRNGLNRCQFVYYLKDLRRATGMGKEME